MFHYLQLTYEQMMTCDLVHKNLAWYQKQLLTLQMRLLILLQWMELLETSPMQRYLVPHGTLRIT